MILSLGVGAASGPVSSPAAAWGLAASSLLALLGYAAAALLPAQRAATVRGVLWVGWLAHALAIGLDLTGLLGPQPGARFGFAPALSMTLWLVLAVYAVESRVVPLPGARRGLAALGVAVVALAWLFPGELRQHTGSPWAPLHWLLGIVSYGLFGVAVLHAVWLNRAERQMRSAMGSGAAPGAVAGAGSGAGGPRIPLLRLERLTFDFLSAGFVVLSAAVLLGIWFANPWRWDHKTVFSLLGWCVFAALLAGRHAFGWRGRRATGWLYVGTALLLLAYVGSHFVLEVLLRRSAAPGQ
ncbi:MAG: cytochrome c biogenesis protein CcsA [Burkholderiaceae bacterium]